jgi:hypothetical protein
MSKDLHNMDEIFNSAYQQYEDDPSPDVWGKINAGLDKKDADSYKRRFMGWKRIAIIAILLLSGFILYEAGILKTGSGHSEENIQAASEAKKAETIAAKKDATINPDHSLSRKSINEEREAITETTADKSKGKTGAIIIPENNASDKATVKIKGSKSGASNKNSRVLPDADQMEIAIISSVPGKNKKDFLKSNEFFSQVKTITPLIEKSNTEEMTAGLLKGIEKIHLPAAVDSLLASDAINKKQKFTGKFKPYWTITAFASNEWANYRLDNDLQTVKKIKQRETHDPSFSMGALMTRQFSARWAVETGLAYSNTSIGISPQQIYAFNDPTGSISYKYIASSGYGYVKPGFGLPPAVGDSLTATEAKNTLKHISVPVVIKYRIGKNKLSFIPGAGIAANFQTSARIETEVENAFNKETVSISKLSGARSFYVSFVADAELQYKLSSKVSISLCPAFRYAISPITRDNVVETYPYSFGAGLGLTYRF